jgi:hypothetical protein
VSEIVKSPRPDHETLHHALVERMVADLRPVRRLWPVRARLALWIALEAGVLLLLIGNGHRSDLAAQLGNPWYLLGVVGFALAGAVSAAFALRSAIPGREPSATEIGVLAVLAGASALLLLKEPLDTSVPLASFIGTGLRCALEIAIFAALPCVALLWAVRRGAPLAAGFDGALVGAGAFLFSFALMRVRCPLDEGLHLLVWHLIPALAGIALAAFLGTMLFRRRIRD